MKNLKIGFIGGGNMGEALIASLLRKKIFRPNQIGVSEPAPERRRVLKKYKITFFHSNADLTQAVPVLLLAVKPQQMNEVLTEISPALRKDHLLLSIAAGLDTRFFESRLPSGTRLIRIMPNSPAVIGEGVSALFANRSARPADRRVALKIFQAAGSAIWIDEEGWLDVVTALSGSGPAFVYEILRSLIAAGESLGLPSAVGQPLLLQTLIGAARLVERSREPIAALLEKVASKGGTTEAGLAVLRNRTTGTVAEILSETIRAAAARARELRGG